MRKFLLILFLICINRLSIQSKQTRALQEPKNKKELKEIKGPQLATGIDDNEDIDGDLVLEHLQNGVPDPPKEQSKSVIFDPYLPVYQYEELTEILDYAKTINAVVCNNSDKRGPTIVRLGNKSFPSLCYATGGCMKKVEWRDDNHGHTMLNKSMYCIQKDDYMPDDAPLICIKQKREYNTTNLKCCNVGSGHFCSNDLLVREPLSYQAWLKRSTGATKRMIGLALLMLIFILIPASAMMFIARWRQIAKYGKKKFGGMDDIMTKEIMLADSFNSYDPTIELSNSGSGAGQPGLAPRTVSRQIELEGEHPIGAGRFGEVWLGNWKGDLVAVKIFPPYEETSWLRELEIYETNMLRHPNVLGFRASDNKDTGLRTELWLVTDYHANGALYDYLRTSVLTIEQAAIFIQSIASGLAFLHAEITGTQCKPGIAHRDIKSKNILVKSDLRCCIADLGMAVRYCNGTLDMPVGTRVGTRRYLPPEVLMNELNGQHFEAFRRADMYSFALVIWEICSRTQHDASTEVPPYRAPYHEFVGSDPTQDEVRKCVCSRPARRPLIQPHWLLNPVSCGLCNLAVECWRSSPHCRLTAMRVRETASKLLEQLKNSEELSTPPITKLITTTTLTSTLATQTDMC